ncbi:hypothetical protein JGU65_13660 [Bacillus sp. T_4]|nr:hypothetical protein [Bacillus sp. T_4]
MENRRKLRLHGRRNFSRSYVQVDKKQVEQPQEIISKKTGMEFLQDTAWVIAVLTGMGYFFSLSYQKGREAFYGIGDISLEDIGLSTVVNSIYDVSSLILIFCLMYFCSKLLIFGLKLFSKVKEKEYMEVFDAYGTDKLSDKFKSDKARESYIKGREYINKKLAKEKFLHGKIIGEFIKRVSIEPNPINAFVTLTFISLVFSTMPYIIFGESYSILKIFIIFIVFSFLLYIIYMISTLASLKLIDLSPTLNEIYVIAVIIFYTKNPLSIIWQICSFSTKIILVISLGFILSFMFYQYGYTQAEKKKDYTLLDYNNKEYVVISKNEKMFLASPLVKKKNQATITKSDYQLIQLTKEISKSSSFKSVEFEGNLQVLPNKRKEYMDKILGIFKFFKDSK